MHLYNKKKLAEDCYCYHHFLELNIFLDVFVHTHITLRVKAIRTLRGDGRRGPHEGNDVRATELDAKEQTAMYSFTTADL